MPWSPGEATGSTKKAKSPKLKKQWSSVANRVLEDTGDDAKAKRIANGVIKKQVAKRKLK